MARFGGPDELRSQGRPHIRVKVDMQTLLAQPYPPQLAVAFGDLLADALQHRALASSEGRPRPMAVPEHTFGHPVYGLTWEHPLLRASAGSGSGPSFVPRVT